MSGSSGSAQGQAKIADSENVEQVEEREHCIGRCEYCECELFDLDECMIMNKGRYDKGAEPIYRCKPCHRLQKRVHDMRQLKPTKFETWSGQLSKEDRTAFMMRAKQMYGDDLKKVRRFTHTHSQNITSHGLREGCLAPPSSPKVGIVH